MQFETVPGQPRRDTAWKRDGKATGIYWRKRANGNKSWGYYAWGKIKPAATRQVAIDAKAKAGLAKSAGLPAPDTRVLIRDLAEEVREAKRSKLRASSFEAFERALDKILLPELGYLKPSQAGPDRLARLIRDLETRGLSPATIRRYLSPLTPIFKLALRRAIIPVSPLALLTDEEKPRGGGIRDHYVWSPDEISSLISAAHELGQRSEARYNYAPILHVLALTGLRISEALAFRWGDIDLLTGDMHVRASLGRDGKLNEPKNRGGNSNTAAPARTRRRAGQHQARKRNGRLLRLRI